MTVAVMRAPDKPMEAFWSGQSFYAGQRRPTIQMIDVEDAALTL